MIGSKNLGHDTVVQNDVILDKEVVKYLLAFFYIWLLDFPQLLAQTSLGLRRHQKVHPLLFGLL